MLMYHFCGEPVNVVENTFHYYTYFVNKPGVPVADYSHHVTVCPRCGCGFEPKNVSFHRWPVGQELILTMPLLAGVWVRVTVSDGLTSSRYRVRFRNDPARTLVVSVADLRLPTPNDIAQRHLSAQQPAANP